MKFPSVVLVGLVVVVLLCMSMSSARPCSAEPSKEPVPVPSQVQEEVAQLLQEPEQVVPIAAIAHEEGSLAKAGGGGKKKGGGNEVNIGLPGVGLPEGKKCVQCALYFSTPNQACVSAAAQWIQDNVYRGDDGYLIENSANNGGWVRYWRVQVCANGAGHSGSCPGGGQWSSNNALPTKGKVHCKHQ